MARSYMVRGVFTLEGLTKEVKANGVELYGSSCKVEFGVKEA
jgi:hypothetical protein